jgi:hypothetical protein
MERLSATLPRPGSGRLSGEIPVETLDLIPLVDSGGRSKPGNDGSTNDELD